MKRVLFVCVENSNRSQMAQAFALAHGGSNVSAWSAGSAPSGHINPRAIAMMRERGYEMTAHRSKSLEEVRDISFDAVITMGCGDACPWLQATTREDWALPDPKTLTDHEFRQVRDEIERRVITLVRQLERPE